MAESANDHYVGSTSIPRRDAGHDTTTAAQARVDARFLTTLSNPRKATRFDRDTLAIIESRTARLALDIEQYAPEGRLKERALAHLEQALSWVNKAIYLDGAVGGEDLRTDHERFADDQAARARAGLPPVGYDESGVSSRPGASRRFRNIHSGVEVTLIGPVTSINGEGYRVEPSDEAASGFFVSALSMAADYEELV